MTLGLLKKDLEIAQGASVCLVPYPANPPVATERLTDEVCFVLRGVVADYHFEVLIVLGEHRLEGTPK
jgi:hypothetical protein